MSFPSLVPEHEQAEGPLYFVLCDYGPRIGKAYYEADPVKSDRATVVAWLRVGQYSNPQQVIEVDLSAGTARDVTHEIFEEAHVRAMHT